MGFEWVPVDEWGDSLPPGQLPVLARTVLSEEAMPGPVAPGPGAPEADPAGQGGSTQLHGRHARAAGGAGHHAGGRSGHRRPPAPWRRYLHFR